MNASGAATWARLWAPELVAGLGGLVVAADRLRPAQGVVWPDQLTPESFSTWHDGLIWPPLPTAIATLGMAALVLAAVTAADFKFASGWRRARMLRWRWEASDLGRGSRLRRIRCINGVATATCTIWDGNWAGLEDRLHVDKGTALRGLSLNLGRGKAAGRVRRWLHLDGWGEPFLASFSTTGHKNPSRSRTLRLSYVPLGEPRDLPVYEQPADGTRIVVGYTTDGLCWVDLDQVPHLRIVGGTGSGKGYALRLVEGQALRSGWLVLLIDGGNSPEHAFLDGAPSVLRPMRNGMSQEEKLRAAIGALKTVVLVTERRSELAELFHATRWADLPQAVQSWQPRILVVVDELTALLAESKDKTLDGLRAQIRQLLDTGTLRNGRKFGVNVVLSDQFAYSGVLPKAASWQAEGVIVLGNLAPEHVKQATGLSSLPPIPDGIESLAGHFVRVGGQARELRVPPNDAAALIRAVDTVRELEAA